MTRPIDKRAARVWKRLAECYGARMVEQFGRDMPESWSEALADLRDENLAYGLRKVMRDSPLHPPTLGQFTSACLDMPSAQLEHGPSIQEQLCAYATLKLFARLDPLQFALPWTYLYREWIDEERPKHLQRCAECTGVLIPARDGHDSFTLTVASMLADREGHAKALRSFAPGPGPRRIAP